MRGRNRLIWLLLMVLVGLALAKWALPPAWSQNQETPTYVGTDTCLGCHQDMAKEFARRPHQKLINNSSLPQAKQGCEACHGPGSAHVEGGGDKEKIRRFVLGDNPNAAQVDEENKVCRSCHSNGRQMAWAASPHALNGLACVSCHDVHQGDDDAILRHPKSAPDPDAPKAGPANQVEAFTASTQLCISCHPAKRAQANMPSHHPLREGKMSCSDCHDPHGGGGDSNLKKETVNETCFTCHAEREGPFAFEHPPVAEDCTICHKPHGSVNRELLAQAEPLICIKCHRGPHTGWAAGGVQKARLNTQILYQSCSGCHVNLHGSDRSATFTY